MTTKLLRNRMGQQSKIPRIETRRSIFDAKWSRKQTMNASYITPIMVKRIYPGDSMFLNMTNFVRLNTQVVAPMDNLQVETFFFYAPDRLYWENFKKWIGAKDNPDDTNNYLRPQVEIPAENMTASSIFNYMTAGRIGKKTKIDAIPFRMYNDIYNEYFRDSDCQDSLTVNKTDSDDSYTIYELKKVHKSRDYFTNSTRDIQQGDPVTLPLGTTAPVIGNGTTIGLTDGTNGVGIGGGSAGAITARAGVYGSDVGDANTGTAYTTAKTLGLSTDADKSGIIADLSDATAATIQALTQGIMTSEYLQALNRGGTKYTDVMANIYNVTIPDLTLQRPLYLGGTSTPLFTNPVIQTSGTGATGTDTPQGNISGYGTAGDNGKVINASFQEFGYIIGLMVIKAQPQYQQGLDKFWTNREFLEEFNPYFVNMPDQAIRRSEIYYEDYDATDTDGNLLNDKVFGYIGRYDDHRYFKNEIAGEFNSEYQYTLDAWHYAEKFENAPENNTSFMEDKTDKILERSLAVVWEVTPEDDEEGVGVKAPQFLVDIEYSGALAAQIPAHAVPKISAFC